MWHMELHTVRELYHYISATVKRIVMTMTRSLSDENKICQFRPYVKFTNRTNCTDRKAIYPSKKWVKVSLMRCNSRTVNTTIRSVCQIHGPYELYGTCRQFTVWRNWRTLTEIDGNWRGLGEQGWRSGESARLPPMCPGFDSRTRRHMWAEFVGSLLCFERFFSGYSGFPLSSKTNIWFDLIWFDERIVN